MNPAVIRERPPQAAPPTVLPSSWQLGKTQGRLVVSALTVVGLLLRLHLLNQSLTGDEVSTYWIVVGHGLGQAVQLTHSPQETTPPLFFVAAWLTQGLLGNPGESIRLVPLVAGTLTIPMTYVLGVRTVGRSAAVVGAALIMGSPFLITYSVDARAYMLATLLVLLAGWFLLRFLDSGGWGWAAGYAVFTCAALYTHYVVVFVLGAQLVWAFWAHRWARRTLVVSNLAALFGFAPWAGRVWSDFHGPNYIAYYQPFGVNTFFRVLERFSLGQGYYTLSTLPGSTGLALLTAGAAVCVVGLALRWRAGRLHLGRFSSRNWLVVVLALATPVGAGLYSLIGSDVFDSRNMIISWPGLALTVGAVVALIPQTLRLLSLVLLVGGLLFGTARLLDPVYQPSDVNGAASYIYRVGTSGDPVVVVPAYAYPLTEEDVAFKDLGGSTPKRFVSYRIDAPPRSASVRAALTQGNAWPPTIHPVAPAVIAKEAATQTAARGRILFYIAGPTPLADYGFFPNTPAAKFLSALPRTLRPFRETTFPGLDGMAEIGVFEFHNTAPRS